jgi:hypothetical protein
MVSPSMQILPQIVERRAPDPSKILHGFLDADFEDPRSTRSSDNGRFSASNAKSGQKSSR